LEDRGRQTGTASGAVSIARLAGVGLEDIQPARGGEGFGTDLACPPGRTRRAHWRRGAPPPDSQQPREQRAQVHRKGRGGGGRDAGGNKDDTSVQGGQRGPAFRGASG